MNTDDKPRFPIEQARAIAAELVHVLAPACERIDIAGSIRRGKETVGDIEIVYVPRMSAQPAGPNELFADSRTLCNQADVCIAELERIGTLGRRLNSKGRESFGQVNKLMRHLPSGIPVDLFATELECWDNYLVCRTGGASTNLRICQAAQLKGWKWNPYGVGFSRDGEVHAVRSEREVFEFLGLPYLEPAART